MLKNKFKVVGTWRSPSPVNDASGDISSHDQAPDEGMDGLPLVWEKSLWQDTEAHRRQVRQAGNAKRNAGESSSGEEQGLEQDNRVSCLEKAVSSLKNENNTLRRHNNFKIVGILAQEEGPNPGVGNPRL